MFGEGTTGGSSSEGDFSVTAQQEHLENQVLKMSLHVENARKMCALAQQKSREAKEDVTKPHSERRHCFVMDYSQNLGLPHFGDDQPGETYYLLLQSFQNLLLWNY
jgi:hypothetical protein